MAMREFLNPGSAARAFRSRLAGASAALAEKFALKGKIPVITVVRRTDGQTPPEVSYATHLSAGFDLRSAEAVVIPPGEWRVVDTGLAIHQPNGKPLLRLAWRGTGIDFVAELQIRPRSGLAAKHGITLLNTPGTVDADYEGPILCTLFNASRKPFTIEPGDRIAQGVFAYAARPASISVREAVRGAGGFGSTGRV